MAHLTSDVDTHRARQRRLRLVPTWVLRRRERRIIARHASPGTTSRPSGDELATLAAIRRELRVRSVPAPRRWRA
jgi:hypothetical protein